MRFGPALGLAALAAASRAREPQENAGPDATSTVAPIEKPATVSAGHPPATYAGLIPRALRSSGAWRRIVYSQAMQFAESIDRNVDSGIS